VLFATSLRFDLVYLKLTRRALKRSVRRYKVQARFRRVVLNLRPGYPLSKKGTNARMGKGHGAFFRWAIRLYAQAPFLFFKGFNRHALKRFLRRLDYLMPLRPYLVYGHGELVGMRGMAPHHPNLPVEGRTF
jgi:ribosomal protein L16/L10AE